MDWSLETELSLTMDSITFNCAASTGTHVFVSGVNNAITVMVVTIYWLLLAQLYNPNTGELVLKSDHIV